MGVGGLEWGFLTALSLLIPLSMMYMNVSIPTETS